MTDPTCDACIGIARSLAVACGLVAATAAMAQGELRLAPVPITVKAEPLTIRYRGPLVREGAKPTHIDYVFVVEGAPPEEKPATVGGSMTGSMQTIADTIGGTKTSMVDQLKKLVARDFGSGEAQLRPQGNAKPEDIPKLTQLGYLRKGITRNVGNVNGLNVILYTRTVYAREDDYGEAAVDIVMEFGPKTEGDKIVFHPTVKQVLKAGPVNTPEGVNAGVMAIRLAAFEREAREKAAQLKIRPYDASSWDNLKTLHEKGTLPVSRSFHWQGGEEKIQLTITKAKGPPDRPMGEGAADKWDE